jgi:peptide/nickel transport system substrate-binding protein
MKSTVGFRLPNPSLRRCTHDPLLANHCSPSHDHATPPKLPSLHGDGERSEMSNLVRLGSSGRRLLPLALRLSLLGSVASGVVLFAAAAGQSKPAKTTARGGSLTFLSSSDVGTLDPGRACAEFDYSVVAPVSRSVFYYTPGGSGISPDLASKPAIVSKDQKTITIHLRRNIRFAPPVNRSVTSADVRYGIERLFTKQVASCYAVIYFGDLVGAPANYGSYKRISGIKTPNAQTIVFHLKHPTAGGFVPALAMPGAIAVPKEYAQKYDRANPSTYARHLVGTGPYMTQSYKPGVSIVLVRNPNWKASTDFRPAYLDRITISEGNSDLSIAAQRALSGSSMICCEQNLPGPALKAASQKPNQLHATSAGGIYFMTLNYKIKPLDNVNVRRAISAVLDRQSFLLTLGGSYAAEPATGWLPPGVPGYTPNEGSNFDFMPKTTGNPAVAKKYMLLAKKQGVPVSADGKYTGKSKLVIMGINTEPASKSPLLVQDALQQLGIQSTVKLVSFEAYNSKYCYYTNLVPAVCAWNSVFKDFPDGLGILAIFDRSLQLTGTLIPSAAVEASVQKALRTPSGPKRAAAWQRSNRIVTSLSNSIPFAWPKTVAVTSANVVAAPINPLYTGTPVDFNYVQLK